VGGAHAAYRRRVGSDAEAELRDCESSNMNLTRLPFAAKGAEIDLRLPADLLATE
jgi:hypothetical protein